MKKLGFEKAWKRFVLYMAMVMAVITASKVVPAYAGDFTTATTLPTNGVWSGKCELGPNTADYYKFTIVTAGQVDVKLMAYAPNLYATLYDSNFKEIDTATPWEGSETSPRMDSIVEWLSQGTYYVSVSDNFGRGGNYKLCTSFSTSGMTAAEMDSYDSPQNLRMNGKVSGVFTNSNQEDWYKVTISSARKYRYILQCSNNFIGCNLYDRNLSELHNMNSWNEKTISKELELTSGVYYIKVSGTRGGTYTCQFNEIIPAKGDLLVDSKNQAQYKVTKAGTKGGTVTYQKSMNGVKTSITVPATVKIDNITYKVTAIASKAFKGNGRLKKVIIGKNVTSIGTSAFYKCTGLRSITIPVNVKSIGKQAFYNCKNLKSVIIKTTKLTSSKVGANAFKGIYKKATIKVPKSKFNTYRNMLKRKGIGKEAVYKKLS